MRFYPAQLSGVSFEVSLRVRLGNCHLFSYNRGRGTRTARGSCALSLQCIAIVRWWNALVSILERAIWEMLLGKTPWACGSLGFFEVLVNDIHNGRIEQL